ncbi:hypothetical protein EG329_006728 [Mollisiaceae sp. DMI_Dod_QoI]|nr:hypothetical protein EG329_006728 [Helotiales sp. DMI_Dod_QoI]
MPTTFHCFRNLPTELRFITWHFALPLFPRIFEFNPKIEDESSEPGDYQYRSNNSSIPRGKLKASGPPILLMVNREARTELLSRYTVSFSWNLNTPNFRPFLGFCPGVDILFIDLEWHSTSEESILRVYKDAFGQDYEAFWKSVPSLAGSGRFWFRFLDRNSESAREIREKSGLEEVLIMEKPAPLTILGHEKVVGLQYMQFTSRRPHACLLHHNGLKDYIKAETGVRVAFKEVIMQASNS